MLDYKSDKKLWKFDFGTVACAWHRQVASLRSARQAHAATKIIRLNGKRERSGVAR